uniref:Uncharacterized protein n=1 Tax=Oryza punctata TaxID=4537 RepID=A0A0E0LCY0_ORYPU
MLVHVAFQRGTEKKNKKRDLHISLHLSLGHICSSLLVLGMDELEAEAGFPKPPGSGLPCPGGKHGYRAVTVVTVVTVVNRTKLNKIYQNFKLFLNLFEFKEVFTVFLLSYTAVSAVTTVTARLPVVLETLG